jgi:hypothetical protein
MNYLYGHKNKVGCCCVCNMMWSLVFHGFAFERSITRAASLLLLLLLLLSIGFVLVVK